MDAGHVGPFAGRRVRDKPRGAALRESFCDDGACARDAAAPHVCWVPLMSDTSPSAVPLADALRRAADRLAQVGVPDAAGGCGAPGRARAWRTAAERSRRPRSAATRSTPADCGAARRPRGDGARRASRFSTSPAPRRSAISSCASARGSSCRGPRPRSWPSSRSTRSRPRHPPPRSRSTSAPAAARSPSRWRPRCRTRASSPPRTRSTRSCGPGRTSRSSAPRTRSSAFIDLEQAFPELDGTVSVVVSNPPYVPDAAIPRDPEVRFFDPPAALYGGDGRARRRARGQPHRAAARASRRH